MFFTGRSNYPIGLDISDLSLKLVQLNKSGNKIKIQALGQISLPEGLIVDGKINNQDKVVEYIKKIINNPGYGKVNTNNVVVCLPETKTFIKLIEVEKTPNNLDDIIEEEIEKHVPLSIDQIYYDYQVIEDRGDILMVLIGAAMKKIVNQYADLFDEAKLSVEALEIEPISLCRSLLKEESSNFKGLYDKNYAIIDIGATRTSMTIYSKNTIIFTISIPISGEKITEDISNNLKIKKEQAEKVKVICGLDENKAQGVVNKVLASTIKELSEKIVETFDFYNNNFSDRGPISSIFLCGGGANIKGIDKIISKAVSIDVKKGDSFINLEGEKVNFLKLFSKHYNLKIKFLKKKNKKTNSDNYLSTIQDSSVTFATSIGLALRGIFINDL